LIRNDDRYVYDIRRDFKASTYNYNSAEAHSGNSTSLLSNGPRVYETGDKLRHIPSWKELDFSLGVTAFGGNWAGSLPLTHSGVMNSMAVHWTTESGIPQTGHLPPPNSDKKM